MVEVATAQEEEVVAAEEATALDDIKNFMFWLQFLAAEARR